MLKTTATASAWLGFIFSVSAQPFIPEFDAVRASFSHAGEMDLDRSGGSLSVSRAELRSALFRPLKPLEGLAIVPIFEYNLTRLDFDGTPANYPLRDEDLHAINLSAFILSNCEGSPWIYGGWLRGKMATDFDHINGDDFSFDVAAGVAYRFTETFTLGAGAAAIHLNADAKLYPGIFFDWAVTDQIRAGFYGPAFAVSYVPDENWAFAFRTDSGGGVWNIDDNGNSRTLDLSSFRLGLYANRRLTDDLWLGVGAGATVGNEISLRRPRGSKLFEEDLDSGLFAQISLRLVTW